MPTIGWVVEDASERYWDSVEFPSYNPLASQSFECPYCSQSYKNESDLVNHTSVDHPIERPVLFLNNEIALSEQTIRYGLDPDGIRLMGASMLMVRKNGGDLTEWSEDQLKKYLCDDDNAHYV
ncbi:MAG: hypothetical protein QGG39_15650, partial [Candidatus Poribacteria bacterium]|nr:hypothetical protein [Candidatus Poribacteria bacterium]